MQSLIGWHFHPSANPARLGVSHSLPRDGFGGAVAEAEIPRIVAPIKEVRPTPLAQKSQNVFALLTSGSSWGDYGQSSGEWSRHRLKTVWVTATGFRLYESRPQEKGSRIPGTFASHKVGHRHFPYAADLGALPRLPH